GATSSGRGRGRGRGCTAATCAAGAAATRAGGGLAGSGENCTNTNSGSCGITGAGWRVGIAMAAPNSNACTPNAAMPARVHAPFGRTQLPVTEPNSAGGPAASADVSEAPDAAPGSERITL